MDIWTILIAIGGSFTAGLINTLAGNGSAITLTILTEVLGLPGNLANGTNRVGVFTQTAASTYGFYRNGRLDITGRKLHIACTLIGAIAGTILATLISNEQFRQVFRFLMVFMLLVILVKPARWLRETDQQAAPSKWIIIPAFLALGFYGGFIQMGMGIIFLAVTVLGARFSLLDANILKSFIIALFTIPVLIIFHMKGLIHWKFGLLMAIGQTAGGYLMAHYASRFPGANIWAYRLLIIMVILAIIKLFDLF
jgi:uncharacterized membrane protein YfcA